MLSSADSYVGPAYQAHARPDQSHHVPNVLPSEHSREDFDFDYKDGVWGPIRIGGICIPSIPVNIPSHVWCKRHGWEEEVDSDELDH
jgi:hypothetical protein